MLGISAVGAGSASAANVELDKGFLKLALPDPLQIIDANSGPVVLTGLDPDVNGDFVVEQADIGFPPFEGELLGTPLAVQVSALGDLSGNYNAATGAMTTDSVNFSAVIALGEEPNTAGCTISPIPLSMSTATNAVFVGNPFDAAASPLNGAISDDWTALPPAVPDAGDDCALIDTATNAPGGLWLSNGNVASPTLVAAPQDPVDPPATPKKAKKCKKAKKKKGKKGASAAKKKKGCKKKKKKKK